MAKTKTTNLEIRYIQPTDYFISDTFNNILDDIDIKVVGVAHLTSGAHWEVWKKQTDYARGDIIRTPHLHSNQYLECLQGGKSGTTEPAVNVTGTEFTDGTAKWIVKILGQTDEKTVSIWLAGENYVRGSLVLYNNKLFRCKTPHQSVKFDTDYSKWQEVYASVSPWVANRYYALGDTVIKDNLLYECTTANTDITFTEAKWKIVGSISIIKDWAQNTDYKENQVVRYRDKLYRANAIHTSGTIFSDNDWTEIYANIPEWKANEQYIVDNVVYKDNIMYICVNSHVSSVFANEMDNWIIFHKLIAYIPSWTQNTYYEAGQVVEKGGIIYRCKTTNKDATFTDSKWEILVKAIVDWKSGDSYPVGQYVNYNGSLYKCTTANSDTTFTPSKWQKIGGSGLDDWKANTAYSVGDYAVYGNLIYKCIKAHTSTSKFTDDFANGDWVEISACITHIDDWVAQKKYKVGDLVAHDAKIYRCVANHTASNDFSTDLKVPDWEELSPTINQITNWGQGKKFAVGDLVMYDNVLYICNTAHTAGTTFDRSKFDVVGNLGTIPNWAKNTQYYKDQVVEYQNTLYRAVDDHKSTNASDGYFGSDDAHWELVYSNIQPYNNDTWYKVGSIVYQDGYLWRCKQSHKTNTNNVGERTFTIGPNFRNYTLAFGREFTLHNIVLNTSYCGGVDIDISTDGTNYTNLWHSDDAGNVENINCNSAHATHIKFTVLNIFDTPSTGASSGAYQGITSAVISTNNAYWEKLGITAGAITIWQANRQYDKDEAVFYQNKIYIAKENHLSGSTFDLTKWKYIDPSLLVDWQAETDYYKDQLIYHENIVYRATEDFTSGSTFADTKLERITRGYLAPWEASTFYNLGECVVYKSSIIRCLTKHTSGSTYDVTEASNWQTIANGVTVIGKWDKKIEYGVGDVVSHGDILYTCINAHTSPNTSFADDVANWKVVNAGIAKWTKDMAYAVDAIVTANNHKLYRCTTAHTSSNGASDTILTDITNWEEISPSIYEWKDTTDYFIDDIVIYKNNLYRCVADHTSSATIDLDYMDWELISGIYEWETNAFYCVGNVVLHDKELYICKIKHVSGTFDTDETAGKWELLSYKQVTDWAKNTKYYPNQLVMSSGILYRAVDKHISSNGASDTIITDIAHWQQVYAGIKTWSANSDYTVGNVVINGNKLYQCTVAHTSTTTFDKDKFTSLDSSSLIPNWATSTVYRVGETVYYNGVLYRANVNHTSNASAWSNDVAKWDLVYANIRDFADSTYYKAGSIVIGKDNKLYKALVNHTSSSSDLPTWTKVLDEHWGGLYRSSGVTYPPHPQTNTVTFDLGAVKNISRLYFELSVWDGTTKSYVDEFTIEYSVDGVEWETYTDSNRYTGTSNGAYHPYIFDLRPDTKAQYVKFTFVNVTLGAGQGSGWGGEIWTQDLRVWDYSSTNFTQITDIMPWQPTHKYYQHDIVKYNDEMWYAKVEHTSTSTFVEDNWEPMTALASEQDIKDMWL